MPPRTRKAATSQSNARKREGRPGTRKSEAKKSQVAQEVQVSPALKTARLSPISQLSPEIFERIFAYYLIDWRYNSHSKLARVCRFWKEVLYSSRRLWSCIDLTVRNKCEYFLQKSQGVPLEVVWDSKPLGWSRSSVMCPVDIMKPLVDRIDTVTIIDRAASLEKLHSLALPRLQHLVLQEYQWNTGALRKAPILLPQCLHALQTLSITDIHLDGGSLYSALQECKSLCDMSLSGVIIKDASVFLPATIPLCHLRRLKLHRTAAVVPILCALHDLPDDAHVTVGLPLEHVGIVANDPNFELNFGPLLFARADVLADRVRFKPPTNSPGIRIRLDIIFGLNPVAWSDLHYFIHEKMLEKPVLDTVHVCEAKRGAAHPDRIPMAQLPAFKNLVVQTGTALEVFDWLLTRAPKEHLRVVESITLDGVHLSTSDPGRLVKEVLPHRAFDHWHTSYQTFFALQELLRVRHEEGSPLKKLSFRRIFSNTPNKAADTLKPFVDTLVKHDLRTVSWT